MVEMEQKTFETTAGKAFQLGRSVLFVETAENGRVRLKICKPVEMRLHQKNYAKYLQTVSDSLPKPVE